MICHPHPNNKNNDNSSNNNTRMISEGNPEGVDDLPTGAECVVLLCLVVDLSIVVFVSFCYFDDLFHRG